MQNYLKDLMEMEHMNKLYDCTRLIDVDGKRLYSEHFIQTSSISIPSFVYESRQDLYHRSILSNTAIYQVNQEDELLLLFSVLPICVNDKNFIMECIANVTDRIDINILLEQSTSLHNSTYRLTITDELTGLYNRRYINQMLPHSITTCANQEIPLSIIFADLDYFKDINDSYGHVAGDYLLFEFATALQQSINENADWVARYGGDEFLLCLVGANSRKAKLIAERIRNDIEQRSFIYHGAEIKTTCSLGVYTIDDFQTLPSCDFIISEIDKRLYQAKNSGRNNVSYVAENL